MKYVDFKRIATVATLTCFAIGVKVRLEGNSRRNGGEVAAACCRSRHLGLIPDQVGCIPGTSCWAGVYVDWTKNEVLHLEPGGRAFIDPGTSTDSGRGCLWWWAQENSLHVDECNGKSISWLGASGEFQRASAQAGKLTGFEFSTRKGGARRQEMPKDEGIIVSKSRLTRDPFGFLFPGCLYALFMDSRPSRPGGKFQQALVVINRDGTVTNAASQESIASWAFVESGPITSTRDYSWVSGDSVFLLFKTDRSQPESRGASTAAKGETNAQLKLSSRDGGRTWLLVSRQGHEGLRASDDVHSRIVLSLLAPTATSMFPLTPAVVPLVSYLSGSRPPDSGEEVVKPMPVLGDKVQPLLEVFEALPTRIGNNEGGSPQLFEAIIVISRAVPRPKRDDELTCVINGARLRAVWLSWSMILCSTTHVKARKVTIYIAFRDKRFSEDFAFEHAPAPRHVRLGWPATEAFDMGMHSVTQEPGEAGLVYPVESGVDAAPRKSLMDTTVAVCTIFKNEAAYLEEWLQYHQLLGISKMYLYDNGSTDKSRDLLRKYERSNFVEVRDWPHRGSQTEALNDCLCRFRHATRWMSFIDVDEFIDPAPDLPIYPEGNFTQDMTSHSDAGDVDFIDSYMSARRKRLRYILEEWAPERHTHCMPWVNYCSHAQVSNPPGGILENYKEIEDMGELKIHMQKPIFKPSEMLSLRRIGPHFLLSAAEDIGVQYRRNLGCPYTWLDPVTFRIRHYRSKSLEEFVRRRAGADAAYQNKRYTYEELSSEWYQANARCGNVDV